MTETKDTNPKDAVGTRKAPFSTVPAGVVAELGVAMLEGARKYGRHNYRVSGVRASVYYDAAFRHLTAWWEGEDIDPDSGLSHVAKAIATLVVLRDAMMNSKFTDDRPPSMAEGWLQGLNGKAGEIIDRHADPKEPCVRATVYVHTLSSGVKLYSTQECVVEAMHDPDGRLEFPRALTISQWGMHK